MARTSVFVGVAFATLTACGPILGVESITIDEGIEAGAPSVPTIGCRVAPDCPALDTEPASCATAECTVGSCVYRAVDADHDGHSSAHCVAKAGVAITAGDDCDDADPDLFPGRDHEGACGETEAGVAIAFPGGTPVGTCKRGTKTCGSDGRAVCKGAIGPDAETCDAVDRNCNGTAGIDEPAPPPPAGTMNCTHVFQCNGGKRGALYFRNGVGFTNVAGADTVWTAYAPRGDFSEMTNPPGTLRISHDDTGMKLGPVTVTSECCPLGCPTMNTFFDGQGQFYTPPP